MNVYLEYKDEKSAKFWKIAVNDDTHTVTYGKIGSDGQSKTKTFENSEKAIKEAEKLVKAKTKKGYQEVGVELSDKISESKSTPKANSPSGVTFIEQAEATKRFNLTQYDPLGSINYDAVLVLEGDTIIDTDIYDNSIDALFFDNARTTTKELIIINGDLMIDGEFSISEAYPCFLVLGDLHCNLLYSGDNTTAVTGDAFIKYVYDGNYNHGATTIQGTTTVPYLLNSDHCSDLNPTSKTILINYYNNSDDFFQYDYYAEDIPNIFPKALLDGEDLDIGAFIDRVKSGKLPFKAGVKPSRVLVENEIKKLAKKNKSEEGLKELDLSEKKLLKLPAALFEMESLEVLNLSENNFTILPDGIGKLIHLKELNLGTTNIKELPASIGQLKNLEVLNLRYCRQLESLPEAIGALSSLKQLNLHAFRGEVPASISKLNQLEELNITRLNVQGQLYNCQPIVFPDWVGELKGLKRLEASENAFTSLPDALSNLSELEFLNLTRSTACLEEITDLSKLESLKELQLTRDSEIRGMYMSLELLSHFFKIKSLEFLTLSRFDGGNSYGKKRRDLNKEDFKGLDQLVNLRQLKIFGIISDGLPEEITKLKQLQKIFINTKHFPGEDKITLKSLKLEVKLLN